MDFAITTLAVPGEIGMVVVTLLGIALGTLLYVFMRWFDTRYEQKWRR